ncbi:S1 RNA-binding domain-containing protein [Kribbella qitaiheensis]|uniref:S1 RNA-binding domain-containing protein n=1 Tax=Kribbella qitaiheensis TaxID=1544730 RepID=UPI0036134540
MNGDLNLATTEHPVFGKVFVVCPYGPRKYGDIEFDHDEFYAKDLVPAIEAAGCVAERADSIYGPESLIGTIWSGLQRSEIVVVDFTGRSPNVALECAWAILLRKKIVILTQDPDDIPTDLRGRFRYIRYSDRHRDIREMREELVKSLEALREEPLREMGLVPLTSAGTEVVPGVVVSTATEFAVIEAAGGRRGVLNNTDVDYARIVPDMTKQFTIGDRVSGAFDVDPHGVPRYTLLAGIANPWLRAREDLPKGTTLTGPVRRVVEGLGAFVDVGNGLCGLIHVSALGGRSVGVGDQVDVAIRYIDSDRRRIALDLNGIRSEGATSRRLSTVSDEATFRVGQRLEAEVRKVVQQPNGGFLLVGVPGRAAPAMLHSSAMTQELRDDLADGEVEPGELLDVEVVTVDQARGRLSVRDLPETGVEAGLDIDGADAGSSVEVPANRDPQKGEIVAAPADLTADEGSGVLSIAS